MMHELSIDNEGQMNDTKNGFPDKEHHDAVKESPIDQKLSSLGFTNIHPRPLKSRYFMTLNRHRYISFSSRCYRFFNGDEYLKFSTNGQGLISVSPSTEKDGNAVKIRRAMRKDGHQYQSYRGFADKNLSDEFDRLLVKVRPHVDFKKVYYRIEGQPLDERILLFDFTNPLPVSRRSNHRRG